jgi:hypothetical protein
MTDVPVISIPRSILRTKTSNGLSVDWLPTDVLWIPGEYYNGKYRKLYFDINGPEEDVKAFWKDVWDNAARENINLEYVFNECEYYDDCSSSSSDSESPDDRPWQVVPAAFFLKHMIGSNTLIVTMDREQIEDTSLIRDPMFFNIINDAIPSGMRLFFIEHVSVGDDDDVYNTEDIGEDGAGATGVIDEADAYVLDEADEDEYLYEDIPGIKGKRMPTYEDEVEMKFLRNRKRNAE